MEAVQGTYDFIKSGGILAILILFIFLVLFGLQREWFVPGVFWRELKERVARLESRNDVYEAHFRDITGLLNNFKEAQERVEKAQIEQHRTVLERLDRLGTDQREVATKLADERRAADRETNELLRDILRALNGGPGAAQRPVRRGT